LFILGAVGAVGATVAGSLGLLIKPIVLIPPSVVSLLGTITETSSFPLATILLCWGASTFTVAPVTLIFTEFFTESPDLLRFVVAGFGCSAGLTGCWGWTTGCWTGFIGCWAGWTGAWGGLIVLLVTGVVWGITTLGF